MWPYFSAEALALVRDLGFAVRATCVPLEEWRFGSTTMALREMNRLLNYRYLDRRQQLGAIPPAVEGPLHRWPEDGKPDCYALAYRAQTRCVAPSIVAVYRISARAAAALGVNQPRRMDLQLEHDFGMVRTHAYYLQNHPAEAARWVGEDAAERGVSKTPDAMIDDTAIEYIGPSYGGGRIADFHRWAIQRKTRYELY